MGKFTREDLNKMTKSGLVHYAFLCGIVLHSNRPKYQLIDLIMHFSK